MNYELHRVAILPLILLITLVGASCASDVGGAEPTGVASAEPVSDDERIDRVLGEISDSPAIDAQARAQLPDGVQHVELEDMLGNEKIRRGTTIDYDHIFGNSTVMVSRVSGGSTVAFCTAQVLNRWFLVTAAHCIPLLYPSGSGTSTTLQVHFTNRAGTRIRIYNANTTGLAEPGFIRGGKDTGLIFMPSRITSCHGTLATCATNQPDVPLNAVFQWFSPGSQRFTRPQYVIVGYGNATDPPATDFGTLRTATMPLMASNFTDNDTGYASALSWSNDNQPRPCAGDSGSPLVVTGFARLLHLGVASVMSNNGLCNTTSGVVLYAGMTTTELNWVSGELNARKSSSVVFDCGASADLSTGLFTFHCDNDSSIY